MCVAVVYFLCVVAVATHGLLSVCCYGVVSYVLLLWQLGLLSVCCYGVLSMCCCCGNSWFTFCSCCSKLVHCLCY